MTFRLGTFNAQNLFERTTSLNLVDEAHTAAILRDIRVFHGPLEHTNHNDIEKQDAQPGLSPVLRSRRQRSSRCWPLASTL